MKTLNANRRIDLLLEDYPEWAGAGRWVHYSKLPQLTINPKASHLDVAGIYLFPEGFTPRGGWKHLSYRIVVEVPSNLRVFDFARMTPPEALWLVRQAGDPRPDQEASIQQGGPYWRKTFWDVLRNIYSVRRGAWNAFFRKFGYDALFDDTDTIFSGETQLVILNPTKAKIVSIDNISYSGYDQVVKITNRLESLLALYGEVTVVPAKRGRAGTWEQDPAILSNLSVQIDPDHYAEWVINTVTLSGYTVPGFISVHLRYSYPTLGSSWGASLALPDPGSDDWAKLKREVGRAMDAVELSIQKRVA